MEMRVQVDGEYSHLFISAFNHDVTSRAIAHGYTSMPDVFEADCDEDGVAYSLGQDFECELYWELLGYNGDKRLGEGIETLIWIFLVAALVLTGVVVGIQRQSVWDGAVWVLMAVAIIAIACIGPFGQTTQAVPR